MSQHLYTSISVFRYWQNAAKLTEQKVRCERRADISISIPCESTGNWSSEPNIAPFLPVQSILATSLTRSPR